MSPAELLAFERCDRIDRQACILRPNRKTTVAVCVVGVGLFAIGCGGRPELAEVTGTVTLDGRPLARGRLTFEAPGLRPASAEIDAGRIVDATTYRPGDGVPVGLQAIAVFAREEPPPPTASNPGQGQFRPESMAGRSLIPRRYNVPGSSGLSAEIRPGRNTLALTLTTLPP